MLTASAERPTSTVIYDARFTDNLPIGPLRELVDSYGGVSCFGDPHETGVAAVVRAYHRGLERGMVTVWAADMIAVRGLGIEPTRIWGEVWWDSYQTRERTWPEAVVEVLEAARREMTSTEIADAVLDAGLRTNVGVTPAASVRAAAAMMCRNGRWEIRQAGPDRWMFDPVEVIADSADGQVEVMVGS